MAILTNDQLAVSRQQACKDDTPMQNLTKPIINNTLQSIEDWFENNRGSLSVSINTATAPAVLTMAQKAKLVKFWLNNKFSRGG